jgi:hypothetical protein
MPNMKLPFLSKYLIINLLLVLILFIPMLIFANSEKVDTTYGVEFRLDLSKAIEQQIFSPDSDQVFMVADHGLVPLRLVQGPGNKYTGIISAGLDSGAIYQYKFRINQDLYETVDRIFVAKPGYQILSSWWNDDPANRTTFLVNMYFARYYGLFDPETDSVYILGTMNNWAGEKLSRIDSTLNYSLTLALEPGETHEFKYRINADSAGLELLFKPNRIMRVPDTLLTISSDFNNFNPAKREITFQCNMEYYIRAHHFDPAADYPVISGNFNVNSRENVLFDQDNDSIYQLSIYLDTIWFSQSPLEFRFGISEDPARSELSGKPPRNYIFHDTTGQNPNFYTCYYNDLDPSIPTPPWVYNVDINGLLIYKKTISGTYNYENVNGIPEGLTRYQWYRCDNALGLNAVAIDSATAINYTIDTVDISQWLVFEVTPVAVSGDSAIGKPVRVVTSGNISAWDVGISEIASLELRIYPNPCDDYFIVDSPSGLQKLEIIDLTGSVVLKHDCSAFPGTEKILTSSLPRGFYLIRASGKEGQVGFGRLIRK